MSEADSTRREFLGASLKTGGGLVAGVSSLAAQTSPEVPAVTKLETPPAVTVELKVNGAPHTFSLDTRTSLLDLLRERLHLSGAKKGCNHGACGACTVLIDGRRALSCLTLAVACEGAAVTTIEGLAQNGALHPLQEAFIEQEGFQCGYCTPGQIVSGVACIAEGHAGSPDQIREWMSGNICRCGAYPGILAAISSVAAKE
jgi:xanthine dehydrogenase YagT iron-sulfur-binding subunit